MEECAQSDYRRVHAEAALPHKSKNVRPLGMEGRWLRVLSVITVLIVITESASCDFRRVHAL